MWNRGVSNCVALGTPPVPDRVHPAATPRASADLSVFVGDVAHALVVVEDLAVLNRLLPVLDRRLQLPATSQQKGGSPHSSLAQKRHTFDEHKDITRPDTLHDCDTGGAPARVAGEYGSKVSGCRRPVSV